MSSSATRPPRGAIVIAGFAVVLIGAVVLAMAAFAPGKAATVLGKPKAPAPSCPTPKRSPRPEQNCQVVARVTAFQTTANGKRAIFKVPADGHIVAWSIDLSKPNKEERDTLTDEFEFGEPSARLAILRQASKSKFKLTKQSPNVKLDKYLGKEPIFTLGKPLRVKKATVVGLTTANWASNFAHDGKLTENGDKWRSSRSRKKCGDDPNKSSQENQADLRESRPHKRIGSTRTYGCTYDEGRVLYQAYFVPARSGGGGN